MHILVLFLCGAVMNLNGSAGTDSSCAKATTYSSSSVSQRSNHIKDADADIFKEVIENQARLVAVAADQRSEFPLNYREESEKLAHLKYKQHKVDCYRQMVEEQKKQTRLMQQQTKILTTIMKAQQKSSDLLVSENDSDEDEE